MSPAVDLTTALSTLAQVSATLAALIGFLGLWKLDWLRREKEQVEVDLRQLTNVDTGPFDLPAAMNRPFDYVLSKAERMVNNPVTDLERLFKPRIEAQRKRRKALPGEEQWLTWALAVFLLLALLVLGAALGGLVYAPALRDSAWGPRAIVAGGLMLVMGTVYMVAEAGGWLRTYRRVAIIFMGIIVAVLVVWVSTGLFDAVAQVPRLEGD